MQITGDVDDPKHADLKILKEWIGHAQHLGTEKPILYLTFSEGYERIQQLAENNGVIVGFHGQQHVPHTGLSSEDVHRAFSKATSKYVRFPFLDFSLDLLKIASKYFQYDSSFMGDCNPYQPFRFRRFIELPITYPTDTWFRTNLDMEAAVSIYRYKIALCGMQKGFRTLLLHPNKFSNSVMKRLLEHSPPKRVNYYPLNT